MTDLKSNESKDMNKGNKAAEFGNTSWANIIPAIVEQANLQLRAKLTNEEAISLGLCLDYIETVSPLQEQIIIDNEVFQLTDFSIPLAWQDRLRPRHVSITGRLSQPDMLIREKGKAMTPLAFNSLVAKLCNYLRVKHSNYTPKDIMQGFSQLPEGSYAIGDTMLMDQESVTKLRMFIDPAYITGGKVFGTFAMKGAYTTWKNHTILELTKEFVAKD